MKANLMKAIALMDNRTLAWFSELIEATPRPIENEEWVYDHLNEVAEARGGWPKVYGWASFIARGGFDEVYARHEARQAKETP